MSDYRLNDKLYVSNTGEVCVIDDACIVSDILNAPILFTDAMLVKRGIGSDNEGYVLEYCSSNTLSIIKDYYSNCKCLDKSFNTFTSYLGNTVVDTILSGSLDNKVLARINLLCGSSYRDSSIDLLKGVFESYLMQLCTVTSHFNLRVLINTISYRVKVMTKNYKCIEGSDLLFSRDVVSDLCVCFEKMLFFNKECRLPFIVHPLVSENTITSNRDMIKDRLTGKLRCRNGVPKFVEMEFHFNVTLENIYKSLI